ncbi:MAG: cupin domain-containing protein [Cellulomonas sp.]|jgi:quercetin dioxygenase-like cupin family protein|uniref:cupin domain-containing protein n=1 Tax=Cellulomonas sp. TaxID=40001 RepID=UPI0019FC16DD|nr:cupin domain-containing protein [Cellulomonas sp.]MBF0689060.1 cupin domain-containing protein [Cellulomonas sp.]
MSATYVGPDEGLHHRMIDGDHVTKAQVKDAVGAFEVFEIVATAEQAAPPHVSPWTGVMYVLEGEVTATVADDTYRVGPGGLVTLPAGTPVTFAASSATARFLAITSGDRAGAFFADLAQTVPPDAPLDEAMTAVATVTARHGVSVTAGGAS